MITVKIKNLRSHDEKTIRFEQKETPSPHMVCNADDFSLSIFGGSPWQRVKNLNQILQTEGWALLCAGARIDAYSSGLLSDSLNGSHVYVGAIGSESEIQSIYDPAPPEKIISLGQTALIDAHMINRSFKEKNRTKNPCDWVQNYLERRRSNIFLSEDELVRYLGLRGINSSDIACRFRGCLLGLAIGDALGTTLEFSPRDKITINDMIGGGPFGLRAGQWTDDTSMTLCAAHSLIESGRFDPECHMVNFLRWRDEGLYSSMDHCFDIGRTTNLAISTYKNTGLYYAGIKDPAQAGNGALMRLAPDVLFYYKQPQLACQVAELSCLITHGATEAIDASRYFSALLCGALKGIGKATLLDGIYEPSPGFWCEKPLCESIERIALGSYKQKSKEQISSTGYVVHTLEAVLWAFYHSDDFSDGALLAVNLAGDSDTIGSIYGQLAGAHYSETGLPIDWISKLYEVENFYILADKLLGFATA
jgi:ADP-ribosyl-[dinitrogen reductase] hydrolase